MAASKTEIKILLLTHGLVQAEIARELGFSKAMVSYVCSGQRRSKVIEEHLAGLLNRSRDSLFGPPPEGESGLVNEFTVPNEKVAS